MTNYQKKCRKPVTVIIKRQNKTSRVACFWKRFGCTECMSTKQKIVYERESFNKAPFCSTDVCRASSVTNPLYWLSLNAF